ncbi:FAD binding domain-containing protein [Rhodococcus chondri]|uniref:Xanthine dehydrogenase family protein subunit M n=1 Tax=Rhodococcus chondri TaxID=3065941 RepID=A0ABU7JYE5_9NOCA|nr:xanthine dehydrogenase family protein subunit M [Rhodococcus sp. CC-R104]MEE2035027.1 xanthine dehydrogenase family protein subunit M [Rhodococcus sp. CC-R104]
MKPSAFEYHAPETAEHAIALVAELGDDAKFIAGGQSLMPMLNLRLAVFDHLVDLRKPVELRGIERRGDRMWIGAGTTHATIGRSAEVADAVPLLARATPLIGHFQIRNRGTLGGSLAHGDGAAEYPVVASVLDAEIETLSPRGRRTVPASQFFTGMWTTALAADELLTGVLFPAWTGRCGFAIEEFARRKGDFALAGAAVAVRVDAEARIDRCAIALFGVGPTPVRCSVLGSELLGRNITEIVAEDVGREALSALTTVSDDLHGPAAYRRRLATTMVTRAWRRAAEEASR